MNVLQNLLVSAAYLFFHCRYFSLISAALLRPSMSKPMVAGTFILNYAVFYICSILELNLVVNWLVFFLCLFVETIPRCEGHWRPALLFSLTGFLQGLSMNILCRCLLSIAIGQPLSIFDNNISSAGNLKFIPVFLGFFFSGLALFLLSRPKALQQLRVIASRPEHLSFLLELVGVVSFYLALNLLLYQCREDSLLLKLWSIKSCVFSLVGFYLGLRYSLQMCWLSDYREQNPIIRQELAQSEQVEAQLRSIAYRDALTGAYNRAFAMERLEALLEQQGKVTLCFLDLDDLKGVNDRYGHEAGDRYLKAAAQELAHACRGDQDLLARFGGDEFLLLLPGAGSAVVETRLEQVDRRLQGLAGSEEYPFPMSISFGVAEGGAEQDAAALFCAADEAMYRRKQAKKAADVPAPPPV